MESFSHVIGFLNNDSDPPPAHLLSHYLSPYIVRQYRSSMSVPWIRIILYKSNVPHMIPFRNFLKCHNFLGKLLLRS